MTSKSYRVTVNYGVKVRREGEFSEFAHVDRYAVYVIGGGQDPVFFEEIPADRGQHKPADRLREMGWEVLGELELNSWGNGEFGRVAKLEKPSLTPMRNRKLADNRCIHGHYAVENVDGDPVAACAGKRGETFGAFNAEGAFYAGDCAVDVANEAAKEKVEDEDVRWAAMCQEHDGEPADTCGECQ